MSREKIKSELMLTSMSTCSFSKKFKKTFLLNFILSFGQFFPFKYNEKICLKIFTLQTGNVLYILKKKKCFSEFLDTGLQRKHFKAINVFHAPDFTDICVYIYYAYIYTHPSLHLGFASCYSIVILATALQLFLLLRTFPLSQDRFQRI